MRRRADLERARAAYAGCGGCGSGAYGKASVLAPHRRTPASSPAMDARRRFERHGHRQHREHRRRGDRRQLRVQDLGARLRRECRAVGHHGACSISRLREAISTRLSHSVVPEHHAERHARRGRRAATPCGRSPSLLARRRRSSLRAREPEALRRPCFDSRLRGCRLRLHARARRRGLKGRRAVCNW